MLPAFPKKWPQRCEIQGLCRRNNTRIWPGWILHDCLCCTQLLWHSITVHHIRYIPERLRKAWANLAIKAWIVEHPGLPSALNRLHRLMSQLGTARTAVRLWKISHRGALLTNETQWTGKFQIVRQVFQMEGHNQTKAAVDSYLPASSHQPVSKMRWLISRTLETLPQLCHVRVDDWGCIIYTGNIVRVLSWDAKVPFNEPTVVQTFCSIVPSLGWRRARRGIGLRPSDLLSYQSAWSRTQSTSRKIFLPATLLNVMRRNDGNWLQQPIPT